MKVYIIPNRYGLLVTVLLGVMVSMAVIYANNAVFLVTFVLASLLLAVMIETNQSAKNLEILDVSISNGFAGNLTELRVLIKNNSSGRVSSIEISPNEDQSSRFEIGPGDQRLCTAHIKIEKRGKHTLNRIRIGTTAPMGLFWSWGYVKPELNYIGFPKPEGITLLPEPNASYDEGTIPTGRFGEDFAGHKAFEPGGSWRRVDWKAVSRGRPWLVKHFEGGDPKAWDFDFAQMPGQVESRLSQLSLWIKRAHSEDRLFSLKLGAVELPIGKGVAHAARCLEELGTYEAA